MGITNEELLKGAKSQFPDLRDPHEITPEETARMIELAKKAAVIEDAEAGELEVVSTDPEWGVTAERPSIKLNRKQRRALGERNPRKHKRIRLRPREE